ncbi:MAG: hypothetical protein JWM10_3585 [Myxococcaceae bacterium]|nr:hypothetical protein [Myxococcaceae bacterium]
MRGRVVQILGGIGVVLGALWFYFTAGGNHGYAEFTQIWSRYLADQAEPKIGLLAVAAGVVAVAVGTVQRRDDAARRPPPAKET